ncbi:Ig-like domain-containing protein [Gemmatimonas sp.]
MRSLLHRPLRWPVSATGAAKSRRPTSPVAIAALLLMGSALGACRSSDGTGPSATPTAVQAQTGNLQTGVAGSALPVTLSVLVTDKDNKPVSGRRVDWDAGAGSGTVAPTSSTTDSRGIATTSWTLGTSAGTARVNAQVNGVNPASFTATVLPGPAASMVATPDEAFLGVGDTLRVRGSLRDQFGNEISGQAITFTSLDDTRATVNTAGLVTAVAQGTARIVATAAARADTVPITVGPPGSGACGTTPAQLLAVGNVINPTAGTSSLSACLEAPVGSLSAEYALTLISTATSFGSSTVADVVSVGTRAPTTAALVAPLPIGNSIAMPAGTFTSNLTSPAEAFERQLRTLEQQALPPLVADAQEALAVPRSVASQTTVSVGSEIKLNANASQACTNPDTRTGRVAAVGSRVIVLSDKENPTGGYTDAEYASIAATFDTLVFPMDTAAFGAPSNISQYGKIILFYTRAVNQLTPQGAGFTIGGFFFARDLYPKTARNGLPSCSSSNEQEMFYLLVPDPDGAINGNRRTKDAVTRLNLTTIAHELQHLINASRRLYVNGSGTTTETVWLDEGLSHLAEELLYFRVSGYSTRSNLALTDVNGVRADNFSTYASQNFSRFYSFLVSPETNSPYAPNDSLATRGAIWNFLRFAAARQGANGEAQFLRQLVNSTSTGVNNLQQVLSGGAFADYLRDWTIALIADDYSSTVTSALGPQYTNPAWSFRSIYPGLRISGGTALGVYPIATRSLVSNVPQRIVLAGGASSYLRFSVQPGQKALIRLSSNGALPASTLRYGIVRLR